MSTINSTTDTSSYMLDYAVNVAKKAKSVIELQGESALKLIDSATTVAAASGANGSPLAETRGTGSVVDMLA